MAVPQWNDIPDDMFTNPRQPLSSNGPLRIHSPALNEDGNTVGESTSQDPLSPQRRTGRRQSPLRRSSASSLKIVGFGALSQPQASGSDMELDAALTKVTTLERALPFPLRGSPGKLDQEAEQFAEALDGWNADPDAPISVRRTEALKLLDKFIDIAAEPARQLRSTYGEEFRKNFQERYTRPTPNRPPVALPYPEVHGGKDIEDLQGWLNELHTWQLFRDIISGHIEGLNEPASPGGDIHSPIHGHDRFTADGDTWLDFISQSATGRERLIILKWLESSTEETGDDLREIQDSMGSNARVFCAQGLMHSRERIKAEKRLRMWDSPLDFGEAGRPGPHVQGSADTLIVSNLDLDASTRLGLPVEPDDAMGERDFWTVCWEMLRRGESMDELSSWCRERNQATSAAMLGAHWQELGSRALENSMSITARYRWRRACAVLATRGSVESFERAAFGLCAGDAPSVEKVSRSWSDILFANINAALLSEYHVWLDLNHPNSLPAHRISGAANSDVNQTPSQLVHRLQTENEVFARTSNTSYAQIQKVLITRDFASTFLCEGVKLARQIHEATVRSPYQMVMPDFHSLMPLDYSNYQLSKDHTCIRILTHIQIIMRRLGLQYETLERDICASNVMLAYMEVLVNAGKISLLPLYAAQFPTSRIEFNMSRALPFVTESTERLEFINLMKSYNMDIIEILVLQFHWMLNTPIEPVRPSPFRILERVKDNMWPGKRVRAPPDTTGETDGELFIQSAEWFLLIDGSWHETFMALATVVRRSLVSGRLNAAIEVATRMSPVDVSLQKTPQVLDGEEIDIMEYDEPFDVPLDRAEILRNFRARTRKRNKGTRIHDRHTLPTPNSKELSNRAEKVLALQNEARRYYDLARLVEVIKCLWDWRLVEEDRINISKDATATNDQVREADENVTQTLAYLKSIISPILSPTFLQVANVIDDESRRQAKSPIAILASVDDEASALQELRETYLPEIVLAYNSVLQSASFLVSRDNCIDSLELGTAIAQNEELTRCFQKAGRMRELVDALASTSKVMLTLNEDKSQQSKRRGKGPKTLAIWDI